MKELQKAKQLPLESCLQNVPAVSEELDRPTVLLGSTRKQLLAVKING